MANDNKKSADARRKSMGRSGKRVLPFGNSELKKKKQQARLAQEEQKMQEKWERESRPRSVRPQPEEKPVSRTKENPEHKEQKSAKRRSGKQNKPKPFTKAKERGFQIIAGGKSKKMAPFLGIVALIVVAIVLFNSIVPIGGIEYVRNIFAGIGSGKGFPVSITASAKNTLVPVGSDIAMLGDSSLYLYKSNGKLLFERQHGFGDPAVTACTARVMVYDRGGKGVRIENRVETVHTLELADPITTACMAKNGYFAVVTRGNSYVSDVAVYDEDAEQTYIWHSASRQVLGAALSDNGRYLSVLAFGVENGQGVTYLLIFDTRKNITLAEKSFVGSAPVAVDYKGNRAVAVLDDRAVSLKRNGDMTEYLYEGGRLSCFDNTNEFGVVLVLGMYHNTRDTRVITLDEKMNLLGQGALTEGVRGVSAKGSTIHLLADQKILFMSRNGKLKGQAALEMDIKRLLCKGNRSVVLGTEVLDELYKD